MKANKLFYPPAGNGVRLFNLASNFRIQNGVLQANCGGVWYDVRLRLFEGEPTLSIEGDADEEQ